MVVILSMGIGLFAPPFGVGFIYRLRDRPRRAGRSHGPHLALSRRSARRGHHRAAFPWLSTGFL